MECCLIVKTLLLSIADDTGPSIPTIPKLKKQDMTLAQLRQYDGKGEHGRICVAVLGKVFDMTRGAKFYGPGTFVKFCVTPYSNLFVKYNLSID